MTSHEGLFLCTGRAVAAHVAGTRCDIHVDPDDGLLTQGGPGYALTCMDARVDALASRPASERRSTSTPSGSTDWPVPAGCAPCWTRTRSTSRHSRPGPASGLQPASRRRRARSSTSSTGRTGTTRPLRPNQLLALALPDGPRGGSLVGRWSPTCSPPIGLRSPSPTSDGYRGAHRGGPADRDRGYHRGTVWPWLVGPLVDAAARAGTDLGPVLTGLEAHLQEYGLGSVSEPADGDAPHAAPAARSRPGRSTRCCGP
jgi:hypothetical protein